jgi:hypothetical protein
MIRKGYRVKYEASKCYWNFGFGGRDGYLLYYKLTQIGKKKLENQMEEYKSRVDLLERGRQISGRMSPSRSAGSKGKEIKSRRETF